MLHLIVGHGRVCQLSSMGPMLKKEDSERIWVLLSHGTNQLLRRVGWGPVRRGSFHKNTEQRS